MLAKAPLTLLAVVAAATLISLPVIADNQSLQEQDRRYGQRLSDMMIAIQLRHFKLWHAGRRNNWRLAQYELEQIRVSFDDANRTYPPALRKHVDDMQRRQDEIGKAIDEKNRTKFNDAFEKFTSACNECHEDASLGFVVIKVPRLSPLETSPLANELFSPM